MAKISLKLSVSPRWIVRQGFPGAFVAYVGVWIGIPLRWLFKVNVT